MRTLLFAGFMLAVGLAIGADKKAKSKSSPVEVWGEVYAPGVDQPYRFGGVEVIAFAGTDLPEKRESFPVAVAASTTDADGRYSLALTPGNYVVFAEVVRTYKNGNKARYEWRVAATVSTAVRLDLNGKNAKVEPVLIPPPYPIRHP